MVPHDTKVKLQDTLASYYKTTYARQHDTGERHKVEDRVYLGDYTDLDNNTDVILVFAVLAALHVDGKAYMSVDAATEIPPHVMTSHLAKEFKCYAEEVRQQDEIMWAHLCYPRKKSGTTLKSGVTAGRKQSGATLKSGATRRSYTVAFTTVESSPELWQQ